MDEDEFLYGPSQPVNAGFDDGLSFGGSGAYGQVVTEENVSRLFGGSEARDFLILVRNGVLDILSLPDLKTVFSSSGFSRGSAIVIDEESEPSLGKSSQILELLGVFLGRSEDEKRFHIVLSCSDGLKIYESFIYDHSLDTEAQLEPGAEIDTYIIPKTIPSDPSRFAIRFKRLSHVHATKDLNIPDDSSDAASQLYAETPSSIRRPRLHPFNHIGHLSTTQYEGIFISGPNPLWIMTATTYDKSSGRVPQLHALKDSAEKFIDVPVPLSPGHGEVWVHPMFVDGGVACFAPFHNVNCELGFVYFNTQVCTYLLKDFKNLTSILLQGQMRIGRLPPLMDYNYPCALFKLPLLRTVHKVAYHHTTSTYIVVSSQPAPFKLSRAQHMGAVAAGTLDDPDQPFPDTSDRDKEAVEEARPYPLTKRFYLELISAVTWETIDVKEFDEYEHVLTIDCINLNTKQTLTGKKLYLIIGCGHARGEDVSNRGKIYVMDIIQIVPDPAHPQITHKFKQIHTADVRGPVGAICGCEGFLVASIGQKVIIHEWEETDTLFGVAFIDVNSYVVSLTSVKGMILVGDIVKSIWFLGFQDDPPKLVLLGKDYGQLQVYATQFLVDDTECSFLVADVDKNLQVLSYLPYNVQSQNGQKLVRKGDIHLGSQVSKILRMKKMAVASSNLPPPATMSPETILSKTQFGLCATLDGGLVLIAPVTEKLYKRLYALYNRLVNGLQHDAGLNPKGYRCVPSLSIAHSSFF